MPQPNCQYTTRYCWEADKVKTLIRLRAELSPLFTGKRNASKYAWAVVERELNVPLPLSKIIKKWNNLLQEYKAIKLSEEPKRREWPFFNLMDVYFSDQVNDPTLRLFSSTKTLGSDSFDYNIKLEDDPVMSSAIAAATAGSLMDISDMMQDAQSDKASENNFDDSKSDVPVNNNSNNNNNNNNNNAHNNYNHVNRHRDYEEKIESSKPQSHTPSYMPQHHNIDQYLLSWNNFHGNMCKGFHNLQKDEKMVDVTIAAGGKIFKAHKLVLSVCSPYFQKIFLEHPSTHPILFMADVNSSHMAGLLDFMYSGQVNVKYEDLPKFLKVAESMQIKGLHTESTTEIDDPKVSPPQRKESKPINNQHDTNIPILNLAREKSFREHIRSKLSPHDILNNNNNTSNNNNNIAYNNNNNNSSSNINSNSTSSNNSANNNNNNNNNNNIPSNYVIHQTNSSSKILDNQKYHKYFSKRKMIAQYEHEMQNDKKNKLSSDENNQSDGTVTPSPHMHTNNNNNNNNGSNNAIKTDDNDCEPNESQSIKVEPDIMMNQDDDSNGGEYYMADLSKRKHSQLDRISLKPQSDTNTRNLSAICS